MDSTPDTPVGNMTTSLVSRDGNSLRRLERDAALLSETQIGLQSFENSEVVLTLLAILAGITENTTSGDVIALSIYRAQDICVQAGVDEAVFREVIAKFAAYSKAARRWNPLAF